MEEILTILKFILALGGMIFVHELGHFIACRWAGIEVEEFGFGLPSYKLATLFKWQGTEFTIHALPLGGFVRPKGEADPNVPGGLGAASPWKRLVVLFAGPVMNLLTAVIVFSFLIASEGVPVSSSIKIDAVSENSPAQIAGLEAGDVLLAINGEEVTEVASAIAIIQANLDKPVQMLVDRNGEQITIIATPLSSRLKTEGALGVGLNTIVYESRSATLTESLSGGVMITGSIATSIVYLPIALIQGVIAPEEARFVGFKGIYDMFSTAVESDAASRDEVVQTPTGEVATRPTYDTFWLIGLLSVSLGVMNLLPIPALDGGRILFTLPEIFLRRRVPMEWENAVNGIAMLLLIGFMLYINVMDFVDPVKIPTP